MNGIKKISNVQLFFILIHSQIGIGIITLPNEVFMKGKTDGWLSVLLAGVIIQIVILLFGFIISRFPSLNLYDVTLVIFGRWVGRLIILLYIFYFITLGGIFLSKFALILKSWMLPLTPKWLLIILLLMLVIYSVNDNLQTIASIFIISSLVMVVYLCFTMYALKDANLTYILPVGEDGLKPILKGIPTSTYSFQGFEYLLFIYPFINSNRKGIIKSASVANIFVTIFYTFVVFVCQVFFSPTELKIIPEPTLYLVKSFTFKIIERPDLLFTSMWIVLVISTIIMITYVSSLGLSIIIKSNKRKLWVIITATISFCISVSVYGEYKIAYLSKLFNPLIFIFSICLPILFILFAVIFNKKENIQ